MSAPRDEFDIVTRLTKRPDGTSQRAVGEGMGCTRQYIEQLESGKRKPSLATACAWARARGYRLALLPAEES